MSSCVYIIDDDEAIRDSLGWMLRSRGLTSQGYASAESFLEIWEASLAGCILLDIRMEGMSGTELFERLKQCGCCMPVIFLTGHGDIPMAVAALKNGAFDFVEKPCNDNELVDRVIEAMRRDALRQSAVVSAEWVQARLLALTVRERQVMERVLAGKLNKVIANELQICMRTVEVHRSSLFEKMEVRTAVELAQKVAGVPPDVLRSG